MASIILPMQIFNFFYTYANFLLIIFKLSPNFIPKSPNSPIPPLNKFNAPSPPKESHLPMLWRFKKLPHSHMDMRMEATKKAPRLDAPALIIIECQLNVLFLVAIPPYRDCPNVVGLVPATCERHVGTWHLCANSLKVVGIVVELV